MVFRVDDVSCELIQMIFSYLWCEDILRCFLGVNNSIDKIIRSYNSYGINLKNISKLNFNLIKNTIRPSQVICLRLSDGMYTPGLLSLFVKHYQIEEFIQLRSIHLHSIDSTELFNNIVYRISKLSQLEIFTVDECYALSDKTTCVTVGSNLSRISVCFSYSLGYGENFFDFSSSRLYSLEYVNCQLDSYGDLSRLCLQMPLLHTLKVGLSDFPSYTSLSPIISPKLKRLQLDFNNGLTRIFSLGNLTFSFVNRLISLLINHLEYLTVIVTNGDGDLADGNAWRDLLCNFVKLRRFDFNFSFIFGRNFDIRSERVESFKSNYWCIEKNWYVVVYPNSIFTIPRFSPHKLELLTCNNVNHYLWTSSPCEHLCYFNTKILLFDQEILEKSQKEKKIYSKSVEQIEWMMCSSKEKNFQSIKSFSLIETTFDLSRVTVFKGVPSKTSKIFVDFIMLLPLVKEIHFRYSPKMFDKVPHLSQIISLRLWINEQDEKCFERDIDNFCRVFSHIEHFHLMRRVENDIIYYLIEQLKHLSTLAILCQSNDEILTNIQQWNSEETILSVSPIDCNVSNSELVAFWIDTSQRDVIQRIKYRRPINIKHRKRCFLF